MQSKVPIHNTNQRATRKLLIQSKLTTLITNVKYISCNLFSFLSSCSNQKHDFGWSNGHLNLATPEQHIRIVKDPQTSSDFGGNSDLEFDLVVLHLFLQLNHILLIPSSPSSRVRWVPNLVSCFLCGNGWSPWTAIMFSWKKSYIASFSKLTFMNLLGFLKFADTPKRCLN